MQHREALRADEMRRGDTAQLPVELREDHVEVDRGPLRGHDPPHHVPPAAKPEHQIAEGIGRGPAGGLAGTPKAYGGRAPPPGARPAAWQGRPTAPPRARA